MWAGFIPLGLEVRAPLANLQLAADIEASGYVAYDDTVDGGWGRTELSPVTLHLIISACAHPDR
jgi:hypothetical protein